MPNPISLSNLADGVAEELFQQALSKIVENIEDPSTSADAARRITMSFEFDVDDSRRVGSITVACATKLAGVRGLKSGVYIGMDEGRLVMVEVPKQEDMFTTPVGKPQPTSLEVSGS